MVKKLNLPGVKERIVAARASLDQFVLGIDQWQFPHPFVDDRAAFLKLMDSYVTASAETWRHVAAVNQKIALKSHEATNDKGGWRGDRNKVRGHLVGRGVGPGPAKVVADVALSSVSPPSDLGISLGYAAPECTVTAESDLAAFTSPFAVKYDSSKTDEELGHYHVVWANHFREYQAAR